MSKAYVAALEDRITWLETALRDQRERLGMEERQEALDERDLPQDCSPPPNARDLHSDAKSITAPVEFLQVRCSPLSACL